MHMIRDASKRCGFRRLIPNWDKSVDFDNGRDGIVRACADSPIITRAGTAFHSSQNVMKELVTRIMPGMKTVVK